MGSHLSNKDIEGYRRRTVPPDRLLEISDHLCECEACFKLIDDPERVQAVSAKIKGALEPPAPSWPEHLNDLQLAGLADGSLDPDERGFADSHLKSCAECQNYLQDLYKIKAQIQREAEQPPVVSAGKIPGMRFRPPVIRFAYGFLCGIAAFALILGIQEYRMRSKVARLENAISRLEEENRILRQKTEENKPGAFSHTLLALKDGSRKIEIDDQGNVRGLEGISGTLAADIRQALTNGKIQIPVVPETSLGHAGTLLGTSPESLSFSILAPSGTAVEDVRPVFEWQQLTGADTYTLMLKDLTTGKEFESGPLNQPKWKTEKPLSRGHQYAWMVEANVGGQLVRAPALDKPYATFKVIDQMQADEIARTRESWGSSHLVMGLVYARAGMVNAAQIEFKQLTIDNPESDAAKSLLSCFDRKANKGSGSK